MTRTCPCGTPVATTRGIPRCDECRLARRRASWRAWKAAKRSTYPDADKQRRREYYLSNAAKIRARQRRYYHDVWKPRDAGVAYPGEGG